MAAQHRAAWLSAILLAVLSLGPVPSQARPVLDAQQTERLSRYEVVLQSEPLGAGSQHHRAVGIIDFPAESVFRVVTSYDRYSEYMPRVLASHVVSQSEGHALVSMEAMLPWPLANVWVFARYQTDGFQDDMDRQAYRVRFTMLRGNMLRYEGLLLLEPYGEGRTMVTYELLAEPDTRMPKSWVQRAIARGASNFVHVLRTRVTQCQRLLRPLPPEACGR